ncbi:MAG: gamma-glutamyl kinase [Pseudomonadota bacterium]
MLVFSKEKLVFLSMPKTGSTAYVEALAPRASLVLREPPELKHAPIYRFDRFFRKPVERFMGEGFDILAVMREPVDWLGSWYRYRRRPHTKGSATSTLEIDFDTFVEGYLCPKKPAFAKIGSQAKFLEPTKDGLAASHVFRYEDQSGLRAFLEDRLDFEFETQKRNVSPEMQTSLSASLKARLKEDYAADFRLYAQIEDAGRYTPLPHGIAKR